MKVNINGKEFPISSYFGETDSVHFSPHSGIDIALPEFTSLPSPIDGEVIRVVEEGTSNLGNGIIMKTKDNQEVIFGHLNEVKVNVGEMVHKGEIIGLSGNTGHSTGAHLHLGLKENGEFVNPEHLLNNFSSGVDSAGNNGIWDSVQEFFWNSSLGEWLVSFGFDLIKADLMFLFPAGVLLCLTLLMGKKKFSSWILPLFYGYFVMKL